MLFRSTSEYDFSVFEVKEHNFSFANLTPEQADEKRKLYEQFVAEKAEAKAGVSPKSEVVSPVSNDQSLTTKPKPAFKPGFKPKAVASPKSEGESPVSNDQSPTTKPKQAFKPSFIKPVIPKSDDPSPASND